MKKEIVVSILVKSTKLPDGRILQIWKNEKLDHVLITKYDDFYSQIGIISEELNNKRKRNVKKSKVWIFQDISFYKEKGKLKIKFIKENQVVFVDYQTMNKYLYPFYNEDGTQGFNVIGKPKKRGITSRFPINIAALL